MRRCARVVVLAIVTSCVSCTASTAVSRAARGDPGWQPSHPARAAPMPLRQDVAGTTLSFELVPVHPARGKPFLVARNETTWDLYDVFVFGFDQAKGESTTQADAVTRPSKPYISMDRGFGHAGFPVISVSFLGAKSFCEWLSAKTGKTYRLPTVAEWKAACDAAGIEPGNAGDVAWYALNAKGATHAVGTSKPDAIGCHDLWGNASEWCVGEDGKGVTIGGSFRDSLEGLGTALVPYSAEWNASDPQFPKSKWWLADGGFVGFRVVRDLDPDLD